MKDVMNATGIMRLLFIFESLIWLGDVLNEKQIQYVVRSTLKGLSYLHFKGILHLDIKAANILLTGTKYGLLNTIIKWFINCQPFLC